MIQGFSCKQTMRLFEGGACPAEWRSVKSVAERKLDMLDAAVSLGDLRAPPGNRLKSLKDDRSGQHSIRVNDKWRVCFVWTDRGPDRVEITDYH
jgi:proteic killer suppression protein